MHLFVTSGLRHWNVAKHNIFFFFLLFFLAKCFRPLITLSKTYLFSLFFSFLIVNVFDNLIVTRKFLHIFLSFPRIFITLFTLLTLFRFFIVSIRDLNTQTYSFIHFRKKIFLVSIHYLWTALCKWKHLLFSCFIYWCLFSYFILTFTYITFSIFFFPPFLSCQHLKPSYKTHSVARRR